MAPTDTEKADQEAMQNALNSDVFNKINDQMHDLLTAHFAQHGAVIDGVALSFQARRGDMTLTLTCEWTAPGADRETVMQNIAESVADTTLGDPLPRLN